MYYSLAWDGFLVRQAGVLLKHDMAFGIEQDCIHHALFVSMAPHTVLSDVQSCISFG